MRDKPGWTVYRFEDFVENVREQTMPTPEDSKNYIGLEHLDSGSLHVRRWGTEIELKGTKFRMKKGDLLFARRNAYLRRVAITPHDGLFSAHGMIFRPKADVVLPGFLPFFLSSDTFMDRAIKISVGSLSPTINWGTLRYEEFSLPPLNEQKRIADLLWSIDDSTEAWNKVLLMIDNLYKRYGHDYLLSNDLKRQELRAVANINMGQSPPGNAYNEEGEGMPFLQGNAEFGEISPKHIKFTSVTTKIASKGDILLSVRAPVGEINIADRQYCIGRGLSALSMKDRDLNVFLKHVLIFLRTDMDKKSTGSTFKAINKHVLETISVPFGDKDSLLAISGRLETIVNIKKEVLVNIENIKRIQKQIINQIFG